MINKKKLHYSYYMPHNDRRIWSLVYGHLLMEDPVVAAVT